ncbi:hypothetical protein AABD55_08045 [Edwardsiella piscicida]|uniref:hypothetical protein n=1 Tax=Edwardsiella piscicida TaxID=1263550 RepID=UPI00370DC20F
MVPEGNRLNDAKIFINKAPGGVLVPGDGLRRRLDQGKDIVGMNFPDPWCVGEQFVPDSQRLIVICHQLLGAGDDRRFGI